VLNPRCSRNWPISDVVVTNAKNVYGPQIADHAFAFLLALTRKTQHHDSTAAARGMAFGRDGMFELDGKTAVIIGVGGIGSQIAQRAHGFGMKVIGWTSGIFRAVT
jgi:phosphoglycerate dehydrogenase-like enzyme